jgi:hypothetical protein
MCKGQINYTEMKNLLQFKINVRKSHRQPHCILKLVCEDCVLSVRVDLHVSYAGSSIQMRASNLSLASTFIFYTSLFIHPHKQKSELGLEIKTGASP